MIQLRLPPAWWRVAFAVFVTGWGANQFAPMLVWYSTALHLSGTVVSATFGMYACGLVPGLLAGGPLSDRFGRRVVLIPALVVSFAATLILAGGASGGVGWLFTGRAVAGVASGAVFSAGGAWIKELCGDAEAAAGARRLAIAMSLGFGVGPLVAGAVAQWAPHAGVVAYLPHLVLALVAFPLACSAPEKRWSGAGTRAWWPRSVAQRRFVGVVLPVAPWVFTAATVAFAHLPGLVVDGVRGGAVVFSGVVTMVTLGTGVLVQSWARRMDGARLLVVALLVVVAGMLAAAGAAVVAHPAGVLVAAVVLGSGYGLCLVCGLLEVQRLAPAHELASATALYQALTYAGFAAPSLLSLLGALWHPAISLVVLAGLAAATLVVVRVASARTTPRPAGPPPRAVVKR